MMMDLLPRVASRPWALIWNPFRIHAHPANDLQYVSIQTSDVRLQTPDSRLQTPDSRLRTPDSRLRTPDSLVWLRLRCSKYSGCSVVPESAFPGCRVTPLCLTDRASDIFPERLQ
jgi:hypothetical protein